MSQMQIRLMSFIFAVALMLVAVAAVAAMVSGGADASDGSDAGPANVQSGTGESYDFGCANLTIGLELLDEIQHPFDLTCSYQGLLWSCSSILAGSITCDHPSDSFSWVCNEQGSENAYCARGGAGSRNTNCAKTGDEINCSGGTEPSFTDCASSGPPPNWDCTTPAGPFHCDADINDFACEIEGLETATPAPTATAEPSTLPWGDVDCDGEISSRDNQAILRIVLSQNPLSQTEPCPDVGQDVHVAVE